MNRETEAEESLGLAESFYSWLFYDILEDIQITFDGTGNLKLREGKHYG